MIKRFQKVDVTEFHAVARSLATEKNDLIAQMAVHAIARLGLNKRPNKVTSVDAVCREIGMVCIAYLSERGCQLTLAGPEGKK